MAYIYRSGGDIALLADGTSDVIKFATGGNSERLRIDSSGRLLVGTTTDASPFSWGLGAQIGGTSTNAGLSIRRDQNSSGGALLIFSKSRGSLNGNTVVQSGDQIGGIYFNGADGTDTNNIAAQIAGEVDGTPGTDDMPGRLIFKTTADGANSPTERMRIESSGKVGIGVTSPEASLHISDTDHGIAAGYVGGTLPDVAGIYTSSSTSHGQAYGSLIVQARAEYSGYGIVFRASNNERARIDSSGRLLVGTTAGTSSGGGAVQTGGVGTMVTNSGSVANNGTLDITVGTSNVCYWSGFLFVNNINGANGNTRTQKTYSVFATNQAAAATFTPIASVDGTNGASSFTVTYVDNGIIRFTNTSGATCNVSIGFFGGGINMT